MRLAPWLQARGIRNGTGFIVLSGDMIAGSTEVISAAYAAGEALGGLGKAGLVTIVVVSVIAIVTFVWIFRETGRRE